MLESSNHILTCNLQDLQRLTSLVIAVLKLAQSTSLEDSPNNPRVLTSLKCTTTVQLSNSNSLQPPSVTAWQISSNKTNMTFPRGVQSNQPINNSHSRMIRSLGREYRLGTTVDLLLKSQVSSCMHHLEARAAYNSFEIKKAF